MEVGVGVEGDWVGAGSWDPEQKQEISAWSCLWISWRSGGGGIRGRMEPGWGCPMIPNKDKKSPLDLACEFGRYSVSAWHVRYGARGLIEKGAETGILPKSLAFVLSLEDSLHKLSGFSTTKYTVSSLNWIWNFMRPLYFWMTQMVHRKNLLLLWRWWVWFIMAREGIGMDILSGWIGEWDDFMSSSTFFSHI